MRLARPLQLAGSEEAFRSLLDLEWARFYALPSSTRSPFIVCSEPGRKNAKRLRELAGEPRYVQTLSHKKGKPLCSVASLDRESVELIATDGLGLGSDAGGVEGGGTFSLEPFTHLAKLAPAVAVDPRPSALLQSGYNDLEWRGGEGNENEFTAVADGGNRLLRTGGNVDNINAGEYNGGERTVPPAVQRAAEAAVAATARAARPKMQRLMESAQRGLVDAIEITLAPRPRWEQRETEGMAKRWLAVADDQASLAKVLERDHFWGKPQGTQVADAAAAAGDDDDDVVVEGEEGGGEKARPSSKEGRYGREYLAHEDEKRMGWTDLVKHVHDGHGSRQWSLSRNFGRRSPGSCGFAQARFSVSPSGKKVLIHKPHEIGGFSGCGKYGEKEGVDDGCLSALLAYISMQPEVHYVTARRRSATMNFDAAWVTQSGVSSYTPFWDEVCVNLNLNVNILFVCSCV